jgi:hypothetical protein
MGPRTAGTTQRQSYFFFVERILKHTLLFSKINTEKASDRNHTFNHLNGWKTTRRLQHKYFSCAASIKSNSIEINNQNLNSFDLLRKKLIYKQKIEESRVQNYYVGCSKCWFWSNNHKERCLKNVVSNIKPEV